MRLALAAANADDDFCKVEKKQCCLYIQLAPVSWIKLALLFLEEYIRYEALKQ